MGSFSLRSKLSVQLFFIVQLFFSLTTSGQSIYVVTSTADYEDIDLADQFCADQTGNCTLRAAIQNANKSMVKDRIHFRIEGSEPHTIRLKEMLPSIMEPVILDATTQPGYSPISPKIILSGEVMTMPLIRHQQRIEKRTKGLHLSGRSSGSIIRGFVLGGFGVRNYDPVNKTRDPYWGYAILIETENNKIQGNFIGIKPDGKTPFPNVWGIADVSYGKNLIGGKTTGDRNFISGNLQIGVFIRTKTVIEGNYIGTDVTGEFSLGNEVGISFIAYSKNNQISNNLISGNEIGVILGGEENILEGNQIGTNFKGTTAISNDIGILISNGANNIIGSRNLISGNGIGIKMFNKRGKNPQGNFIIGNLIGTDITGTKSISNETGILVLGGSKNIIGGPKFSHRNVISGNNGAGIQLIEADNNRIENNFMGTTGDGAVALPNETGILFEEQDAYERNSNNTIINNLISGNFKDGVYLGSAVHTTFKGNRIGLQKKGISPLPNGGNGIRISASAIANCIGGKESSEANLIGFNHDYGIKFENADHPQSFYTSQLFYNRFYNNCRANVYPPHAWSDIISSKLLAEH